MRILHYCEVCDRKFTDLQECIEHEKTCNPTVFFTCYKCGKHESWGVKDDVHGHLEESWHKIRLGRMGYGSSLDGSDVNFTLCDTCLCELVESFSEWGKDAVKNSGSNYYDVDHVPYDDIYDTDDPETDPSLEDVYWESPKPSVLSDADYEELKAREEFNGF